MSNSKRIKMMKVKAALLGLLMLAGGSCQAQTEDQLAKMTPKEIAAMVVDQASRMADVLDVARSEGSVPAQLAAAMATARESVPRSVPGAGPWGDRFGGLGFDVSSGALCSELVKSCQAVEGGGHCSCTPTKAGKFSFVFVLPRAGH